MPNLASMALMGLTTALLLHVAVSGLSSLAAISPPIAFLIILIAIGIGLIVWR